MVGKGPLPRLLRGHRAQLAALAVMALIGGLAESVVLVVIVEAAVALSAHTPGSFQAGPVHLASVSVTTLLVVALVATIVRLAAALGVAWVGARLTADVQREMRVAMFDAYIDADWPAQSREREGGLQQMIGLEIDRSAGAVLMLATGLAAACSLCVLTGAALLVNPPGALGLIIAVAGLFVLLRPMSRRIRRHASARSAEELGVAESLNELVRTSEEIRVHGVSEEEKRRLAMETARVSDWVARIQFASLSISNLYQGAALGLVVVALFVVNGLGASSVAGAGAIVLILLRAFAYSQQVQQAHQQIGERMASVVSVDDRLGLYHVNKAPAGTVALGSVEVLEFRDVSYWYRPGKAALGDVSFNVERGEVIGVVGPSGAGKSTLVQLLLRLRAPVEGNYLVNGRDAAQYTNRDWARNVSFLPQQPKLIAGTVAENIRFFRDVTSDQIGRAARMANLHDEIISWPQGYATVVGQRADALSGGQAQRLCLARALVTNPALLVLDEPTSALDAISEHSVQQALGAVRGQTTIFIIAHRLSTLSICDRILVLKDGRLEAIGTRQRLADEGGFYQEALRLSGLA